MKIGVKRNINNYDIIYGFILSMALLGGYFGGEKIVFWWANSLWSTGIVIMFVVMLSGKIGKKIARMVIAGISIFTVFLGINYAMGIDRGYLIQNLLSIMKVTIFFISIMIFARNLRSNYYERLKKSFWIFNIWAVLNMVVLTIQINVRGFMMPAAWLSMGAYVDSCSGLFGLNGTHRLGIFMTFIFIYNQYIADYVVSKIHKKKIIIFNLFLLTWHLILSTQNDNVAIFILTFLFFIIYLFLRGYWESSSFSMKVYKWSKYILIIMLVALIALCIPSIRTFALGKVMERIFNFTMVTSFSTGSGSTERLGIVLYSLANGFGLMMGKGIGYHPFGGDMVKNVSLGFVYFGLSNMSSMIYLLGIWFYCFMVFAFSKMYQILTKDDSNILFLIIVLTMFLLTFYTTPLTSTPMTIWLVFIFSVLGMLNESIQEKRLSKSKK